jgi:Family of unknown function (DUF6459)
MPPAELPALRLVRVPEAAPPYDCPAHGAGCQAAAESALAVATLVADTSLADTSAADTVAADTSLADTSAADTVAAGTAGRGQAGGTDRDGGIAVPWRLAQVIVEILAGFRSPGQLVALTTDRARGQVRRLAPRLVTDRRPRIQRVVSSRPAAGTVEMTVIVSFGPRPRALALRFEHMAERPATPGRPTRPARWVCTAVEAG